MLYIDSPAGTGLSFSTDPKKDYNCSDFQTATDLLAFLQAWFADYPKFAGNPFYLAGAPFVTPISDQMASGPSILVQHVPVVLMIRDHTFHHHIRYHVKGFENLVEGLYICYRYEEMQQRCCYPTQTNSQVSPNACKALHRFCCGLHHEF